MFGSNLRENPMMRDDGLHPIIHRHVKKYHNHKARLHRISGWKSPTAHSLARRVEDVPEDDLSTIKMDYLSTMAYDIAIINGFQVH